MRYRELISEGQPLRGQDPGVVAWLEAACARPDADELFLHGSEEEFEAFAAPKTEWGRMIFATKLVNDYHPPGTPSKLPFQAEYYGSRLYLLKIAPRKMFSPRNDPRAAEIMRAALGAGEHGSPVWDHENKLRYGRFDYQDAHRIVPPAVAAGYDFFRVHECSTNGDSYAATRPDMIHIVDRYRPKA